MDNEHPSALPHEDDNHATPVTGPLVLSQMQHHAVRPISFPPARATAVWAGDDLPADLHSLLADLDDDADALPPPPAEPSELPPSTNGAVPDELLTTLPGTVPQQRRMRPGLLAVGLLLLLVLALLATYVLLFPQIVPQATITLTPASATLSTSLVVTALPGSVPDPARQQIAARLLAVTSPAERASGPTSGTGHQPARAASGTLTFYNAAPYAQTIAAGTRITGAGGIAVLTEMAVTLPTGNPPTFGIASVAAHAATPGPQGNLAPLGVNGLCCAAGVSVKHTSAFAGGQAARTFPVATVQDISALAAPLVARLSETAQAQVQAEVRPTEQLVSLVACTPQVTPDHPLGSEAARVSITVAVTCRGETYDQGAVTQLAQHKLNQQAAALGSGYALVGSISTIVTQQVMTGATHSTAPGTLVLLVSAQGTWAYQFSSAALHTDARLLAGKSVQAARALLLSREAGHVRLVVIHLSGWWSDGVTLPTDASAIHLLVVIIP